MLDFSIFVVVWVLLSRPRLFVKHALKISLLRAAMLRREQDALLLYAIAADACRTELKLPTAGVVCLSVLPESAAVSGSGRLASPSAHEPPVHHATACPLRARRLQLVCRDFATKGTLLAHPRAVVRKYYFHVPFTYDLLPFFFLLSFCYLRRLPYAFVSVDGSRP